MGPTEEELAAAENSSDPLQEENERLKKELNKAKEDSTRWKNCYERSHQEVNESKCYHNGFRDAVIVMLNHRREIECRHPHDPPF